MISESNYKPAQTSSLCQSPAISTIINTVLNSSTTSLDYSNNSLSNSNSSSLPNSVSNSTNSPSASSSITSSSTEKSPSSKSACPEPISPFSQYLARFTPSYSASTTAISPQTAEVSSCISVNKHIPGSILRNKEIPILATHSNTLYSSNSELQIRNKNKTNFKQNNLSLDSILVSTNISNTKTPITNNEMLASQDTSVMSSSSTKPTSNNNISSQLSQFNQLGTTPSKINATSLSDVATPNTENVAVCGKLKVRITEAHDVFVPSPNTSPYVVCTFNSSEFITHEAPSSSTSSSAETGSSKPTGIAIPTRQSTSAFTALFNKVKGTAGTTTSPSSTPGNPKWTDEAQFDVTSEQADIDISIYDAQADDAFLGRVLIHTNLLKEPNFDQWIPLQPRGSGDRVTGEVHVQMKYEPVRNRSIGPDDFEILRLVGKGTFGQVYQVRKKDTQRIYAMKVLSKKIIVQKKEIAHTIGERDILVRTALSDSNFIVGLKFSFQTPTDLYLVTDYMSGGELFWHLQKESRFSEERAKFYIAELIIALEHLHDNDIVYRDLKPENILLDANGHIALCDFGLSKANLSDNGTTNTFCGTTEYLAPEVLLDDKGYTKMVDFWSLGVLVFEMCCGWSPFYAEDVQQMYKNIAFGKVRFPKDALSHDGRNFVKGLLNRNPRHRLGANGDTRELKAHPFFKDIDWDALAAKLIPPPFKPVISSETDTSNFDPEFTQASTSVLKKGFLPMGSTPLSPGIQAKFQGFTYVDESSMDHHMQSRLGTSLRPVEYREDDIELYDDNDIESAVQYNTDHGLSNNQLLEDEDVGMSDDDDDGYVNGQRFEM